MEKQSLSTLLIVVLFVFGCGSTMIDAATSSSIPINDPSCICSAVDNSNEVGVPYLTADLSSKQFIIEPPKYGATSYKDGLIVTWGGAYHSPVQPAYACYAYGTGHIDPITGHSIVSLQTYSIMPDGTKKCSQPDRIKFVQ